MKHVLSGLAMALASASALAAHSPYGSYAGSCIGYYGNQTSAPCAQSLYIGPDNSVTSSGCISQTAFGGLFYGAHQPLQLQAPGWAAQPAGQVLTLTFQRQGWHWTASGSGYGISDRKWTYHCSFNQQ